MKLGSNNSLFDPVVSVIMPVYNGGAYLKESIESILRQSFKNFELIIVNDGSTDNSEAVIGQFSDSRIHYIKQENQGLASSLNNAITIARGTYIARQDQDDISKRERFAKQVSFLKTHPQIGVVGAWAEIVSENKRTGRYLKHPTKNIELQFAVLFDTPFVHSSVMLPRSVVEAIGGYTTDLKRQPPEDFELWSRIARSYQLANIPETLLLYREIQGSMSRISKNPFGAKAMMICAENIGQLLHMSSCDPTIEMLANLLHQPKQAKPVVSQAKVLSLLEDVVNKVTEAHGAPKFALESLANIKKDQLAYHYPQPLVGHLLSRARRKIISIKKRQWNVAV